MPEKTLTPYELMSKEVLKVSEAYEKMSNKEKHEYIRKIAGELAEETRNEET